MSVTAYRAAILHFLAEPQVSDPWAAMEYFADGLLLVQDGLVLAVGATDDVQAQLPPGCSQVDYRGCLLLPGLVDAHLHYVQGDIIASYGKQLLDWLQEYTFPAEQAYGDAGVAAAGAARFLAELRRNGTTSALVMTSVHGASVTALCQAAEQANMRLITGKTLMDRNCPEPLQDSASSGYADSLELINRWRGRGRLGYAVSPRFAPTSTPEQLALAGQLLADHPDVLMQTHLAENHAELAWVAKLFPDARSYLDVYAGFGLLGERSIFAHCIHLDAEDRAQFAAAGATVAHCPTSNLFLGSGLFDLATADASGMQLALGTDIGAGTSYSLLQTMGAAYGVTHTAGSALHPARAWYLATLGGAKALRVDQHIGNFLPGKEADFVLLDPAATPLLQRRTGLARSVQDVLFALMILADDRAVRATHLMGRCVHDRDQAHLQN